MSRRGPHPQPWALRFFFSTISALWSSSTILRVDFLLPREFWTFWLLSFSPAVSFPSRVTTWIPATSENVKDSKGCYICLPLYYYQCILYMYLPLYLLMYTCKCTCWCIHVPLLRLLDFFSVYVLVIAVCVHLSTSGLCLHEPQSDHLYLHVVFWMCLRLSDWQVTWELTFTYVNLIHWCLIGVNCNTVLWCRVWGLVCDWLDVVGFSQLTR